METRADYNAEAMIQIAYPEHIEALCMPFTTARELLRYGVFMALERASYWRKHGNRKAAEAIETMVAQGREAIQWLDEQRIAELEKDAATASKD